MQTAGHLAAALTFFIYGWYVGIVAGPLFPESAPPGFLIPLTIGVAVFCGWTIAGSRGGRGYNAATGNGLTTGLAFAFWTIFILAFEDMIVRSMRRSYDGPMEAVVDVFRLMLDFGLRLANFELILTVVVGSILCGYITEYFAKRYP